MIKAITASMMTMIAALMPPPMAGSGLVDAGSW